MPQQIKNKIKEIIKIKKKGTEREIIQRINPLDNYIERFLKQEIIIRKKPKKPDMKIIEREIRKMLLKK